MWYWFLDRHVEWIGRKRLVVFLFYFTVMQWDIFSEMVGYFHGVFQFFLVASDIQNMQQALHDSEKKANTYMKRYSRVQVRSYLF